MEGLTPVDYARSLSPLLNARQINESSATAGDGGKSGEFFFFSHDNNLMLKTVSKQELRVIRHILPNYYEHLKNNRDSLITRIYGIFEFHDLEDESIILILMRNIRGCSTAVKETVLRKYDIKGSSFDREVLRGVDGANLDDKEPCERTLKDTDFLQLERCLNLDLALSASLLTRLERDAAFFMRNGIIDYSVFIIKIAIDDSEEEE